MRDCFTPVESNEQNRKGHGYFYTLTSTKKQQQRLKIYERTSFAWNPHNLPAKGKEYEFYPVFSVFIVRNIGNICENRKSSIQSALFFFFFKGAIRLNAWKSYSSLKAPRVEKGWRRYNIWETLGSFSRLGWFLNESPAAASPSNCNMCLHTVILMKGNDGVHFNDVEFKDCLLFQRKAIVFHGNMSISFFLTVQFHLRNRHWRLNALYGLSKYDKKKKSRFWNRYIDNVLLCCYHCFGNASSEFLFNLSRRLCKTEYGPNYHRHQSHSVSL